jgi:hypothetical protein
MADDWKRRQRFLSKRTGCAKVTILKGGFETRVGFCHRDPSGTGQQQEKPMSNQHSVTKRHRLPKSGKRTDYTARTMAAVKQLSQAVKLSESQSPLPKSV